MLFRKKKMSKKTRIKGGKMRTRRVNLKGGSRRKSRRIKSRGRISRGGRFCIVQLRRTR